MSIRNDQIACGTTSTGTGALTLAAPPAAVTAADPFAAFSGSGFGTTTGVPVAYSIVEYTDTTFTKPKQSESGRGVLNIGASLVATTLTRTTPIQTATSMDSQPATVTGQVSAPTAITIGTAANVVIWFGDLSWLFTEALPYYSTSGITSADGLGVAPWGSAASGQTFSFTNQQAIHAPVCIGSSGIIKSCSFRGTTAYTGGTASLSAALYEIGSNGLAGKKLIDFGSSASIPASNITLTASAAVFIPAGIYILETLPQFTGGSGAVAIRSVPNICPSPFGTAFGSLSGPIVATVAAQTSLTDPSTNTSIAANGSNNNVPSVAFRST